MTFIDLFSGIGGFRLGLEQAGHTCKGHCEIDRFANQSYVAIHQPKEGEWFASDITKVRATDIPRVDIWCFGFPCQDISTAGKQKGMRDGTRSGLFFAVAKLIRQTAEEDRPKYLFIENVKNLLSINSGWDFATVLFELDDLGYDAEWQVLNSKNFGVPQNRERVFVVGHFRGRSGGKVFPIEGENGSVIKQLGNIVKSKGTFTDPQRGRIYSTNGISPCLNCMQGGGLEPKILEAIPVLTPDRAYKAQNGRRFKTNGEPSFTLTAQDRHGVAIKEATKKGYAIAEAGDSVNLSYPDSKTRRGRVGKGIANTIMTGKEQGVVFIDPAGVTTHKGVNSGVLVTSRKIGKEVNVSNTLGGRNPLGYMGNNQPITMIRESAYRIRRLTPKECWRLQGFPDWAFDRAKAAGVSDSQLYKQAGNSVTVNVIKAIGERLQ